MRRFLLASIFAILTITATIYAFDRSIEVDIGGFDGLRFEIEAEVEEPQGAFEWIELRPRYALLGIGQIRDYGEDGLYYNIIPMATAGGIDLAGGLVGLDLAVGLHLSEIRDNYRFHDLIIGLKFSSNYTFWLEREYIGAEFTIAMGNGFVAGWGEIVSNPWDNLTIGAGMHYDGELDHWGEPLPFQDEQSWPDRWNNGLNYYLTIGYIFDI